MRPNTPYRVAIVGAPSLAGKELSDALSESPFAASNFTLLDDDVVTGQIAAAGDEISFIQKIDSTSFENTDLVFFAGDGATTNKYWQDARRSGAAIIDLTYTLEERDGIPVLSPWISANAGLNLETTAVVSAHPAAVMLALVSRRIANKFEVNTFAATVLEPASQYGKSAMDELHQQTVSLLSFQSLPRERYDAQVAFNLLSNLGEEAKISLKETGMRIQKHYRLLTGLPQLGLQLIHAPVFHGYVASVFVDLESDATVEEVELALIGDHIDLVSRESEPPSNLSATGQEEIMVRVEPAGLDEGAMKQFKFLLAADNLKLAAANAIACGIELAQLRPSGKVQ